MALNLNKVMIAGRLCKDPELRTTQSGTNVCTFSLAVNKPGNTDEASFFDVSAWKDRADFVKKYFTKGMPIYIEGWLNQHKWTNQDGQTRYAIDINAERVDFVESKNTSQASRSSGGTENLGNIPGVFQDAPKPAAAAPTYVLNDDDELPF